MNKMKEMMINNKKWGWWSDSLQYCQSQPPPKTPVTGNASQALIRRDLRRMLFEVSMKYSMEYSNPSFT
jgi:hypothetical protein